MVRVPEPSPTQEHEGPAQPQAPLSRADIMGALTHALNNRLRLYDALSDLVAIIDAAGLLNLSNGVQLGQTSWYVKASERLEYARLVLREATISTDGSPSDRVPEGAEPSTGRRGANPETEGGG